MYRNTISRRHKDLIIILAITLLGALLAIAGLRLGAWVAVFGILMVLVFPGYLFSLLLLPRLPFEERLLVSVGLSIVITGFSGLLLDLVKVPLTPVSWAIWLALVILAGVALIWRRRAAEQALPFTFNMPKIAWPAVVSIGLTLALVVAALVISQGGSSQLKVPLTLLWANYDPQQPNVISVSVRNEEKTPMTYNILMQQNGAQVNEWAGISLDPGATFTGSYTFPQRPQQPATIQLFLADKPGSVYRQVRLDFSQGAARVTGK